MALAEAQGRAEELTAWRFAQLGAWIYRAAGTAVEARDLMGPMRYLSFAAPTPIAGISQAKQLEALLGK